MIGKIEKALLEGNFLEKSIIFLVTKLPVIILKKIDWVLGCMARWFYAVFIPIKENQIMFISFQGDYTCNPKYIAEELRKRGSKYQFVFSARKASLVKKQDFPPNCILVEQYTAGFYREIAKSKLIIANSVEFLKKPTPKKHGQVLMETWHGSLGIKRFGEKYNSGKTWIAAAKRCGQYSDYILSNSDFEDDVYRDTFWKHTNILKYGHPRNDILFLSSDELRRRLKLKILGNNKELLDYNVILYAPTFRDNHTLSCYDLEFERLCQCLSVRFGGKWIVLLRLHPTVRKQARKSLIRENVVDVTAYPDIQEIMVITDIAITDYSSWIFDFILTGRPGFLYAVDIASYVDERGFYYPLTKTPFPLAVSNDQMMQNILDFDEVKYQEQVENFLEDKGCIEDGKAAQRTADKIIELMENLEK